MPQFGHVVYNSHLGHVCWEDENLGLSGPLTVHKILPQIASLESCECEGLMKKYSVQPDHFNTRKIVRQLLHIRQFLLLEHFFSQYGTLEEMVLAYAKPENRKSLRQLFKNPDIRPHLLPRIKIPTLNSKCAFFDYNMKNRVETWSEARYRKMRGVETISSPVGHIPEEIDIPKRVTRFINRVCVDSTRIWPNAVDRPIELLVEILSCTPEFEKLITTASLGNSLGFGGPAGYGIDLPMNLDAVNQLRRRQNAHRNRLIRESQDDWGRDLLWGHVQYVSFDPEGAPISREVRKALKKNRVRQNDRLDEFEEAEDNDDLQFEAVRELEELEVLLTNEEYIADRDATPGMVPPTIGIYST